MQDNNYIRGYRYVQTKLHTYKGIAANNSRKEAKGYKSDTDLTEEDLIQLCEDFKVRVKEVLGQEFPDDAKAQLWGGIGAVFKSWNGRRAIAYRRIENIPDENLDLEGSIEYMLKVIKERL